MSYRQQTDHLERVSIWRRSAIALIEIGPKGNLEGM